MYYLMSYSHKRVAFLFAMQKRVLIVDKMHDSLSELLLQAGFTPDYQPLITRSEILRIISSYQVIVIRSKTPVDRELIDKATSLQVVARAGSGTDQIDTDLLSQRGIQLITAPEGNCDAVAEHALGMLLALMNKMLLADRLVRQKIWQREAHRGYELMGKTVGIIGYGHTGRAFARRLSGFGCLVLAYDKYKTGFSDAFTREASLSDLLQHADVLSLHIPLTWETRGWINEDFLDQFAKPIWLINTSRGEIVPFIALRRGLQKGKLLGACLDVLEQESLERLTAEQAVDFEWLAAQPNVIFTPHVAGWTHESYQRINRVLVDKLTRLMA